MGRLFRDQVGKQHYGFQCRRRTNRHRSKHSGLHSGGTPGDVGSVSRTRSDYSCTVELSEATAAKIPGVRFQAMKSIGHFPFAENPKRFAEYLLPILAELKG